MKASDARVFCSSSCAFAEPVAGLAFEERYPYFPPIATFFELNSS